MELTIEKLVYGGEGLARVDGEVIFTPFVLPGEKVSADRIPARKGAARARLTEVLAASAKRVEPECPVFTNCGGCQYQHISYGTQVKLKRGILAETLRRVGRIEYEEAQIRIEAEEPWGYRNRVQFHFEDGKVGFRAMGSRRLVPTTECPVASPKINEALEKLTEMVTDRRWPKFVQSMELFTDEEQLQWNVLETERPVAKHFFDWLAEEMPGSVAGPLDYRVGEDVFQVSGSSFFQVNRHLAGKLAEVAIGDSAGARAWDLYAGVGLFSLAMARRFEKVVAVESGRTAVRDLAVNTGRAGVAVEAAELPSDAFLMEQGEAAEFVLADPPREGIGKLAVERLLELKPQTLVIVACDPATLARDLAGLRAGFEIAEITMVDLFPQTFHMETIVKLRRS